MVDGFESRDNWMNRFRLQKCQSMQTILRKISYRIFSLDFIYSIAFAISHIKESKRKCGKKKYFLPFFHNANVGNRNFAGEWNCINES